MKKLTSILLAAALAAGILSGCTAGNPSSAASGAKEKPYRIGIIQPVEHTSLNQIREAVIAELNANSAEGSIEIIYKNGQGDAANTNTIVSQFVGDGVDMIIPIATGPAQVAAAATKEIPIVFAAVSYPVEAGLVPSMEETKGNITGVSNAIAIEDIIALSGRLTPDVKTIGMIYNSGEVNSVSSTNRAKAYCDKVGLKYVEATITSSGDLLQAVQSLNGKVDAIFSPNDNTVASAMATLAAEAIKAKLPVYVGADSMVLDGGLATVGIDYDILGRQVAQMALRIKGGEAIADNPVEIVSEYANMVNPVTAKAIGLELPQDVLDTFKLIETKTK